MPSNTIVCGKFFVWQKGERNDTNTSMFCSASNIQVASTKGTDNIHPNCFYNQKTESRKRFQFLWKGWSWSHAMTDMLFPCYRTSQMDHSVCKKTGTALHVSIYNHNQKQKIPPDSSADLWLFQTPLPEQTPQTNKMSTSNFVFEEKKIVCQKMNTSFAILFSFAENSFAIVTTYH
jgi:hypothetical protein